VALAASLQKTKSRVVIMPDKPTYEELEQRVRELEQAESERKRAEKALRESEHKYRDIFDDAVMGVFHTSPEGRFLTANPAGARMYGYDSPDDLIRSVDHMSRQIYVNPTDWERFKEMMERTGLVEGFESEHFRKP
jgi:PAS domain-containing protein